MSLLEKLLGRKPKTAAVDMLALNITLPENKKGQPAPEAGKTDKP